MSDGGREDIDRRIESGHAASAVEHLRLFWNQSPGSASAAFVVARFEKLRPRLQLKPCKVAILRSFTVEPAVPMLRAMGFLAGLDLDVRLGDFGTYVQDVLNAQGWLYEFAPDVVIVAVRTGDVTPALWADFADLDRPAAEAAVAGASATFKQIIETFRAHSKAHLIVHSLETPAIPSQGLLDARGAFGQLACIRKINDAFADLARSSRNVYVLDYGALIARRGHAAWHDERKWLLARMPIAANELVHLAREWMRFFHPIMGRVCKVLAIDLDNTLWGGVIGEDGIDGIKLDHGYPGDAYRALQRAILDLYRRGILLAICSRNNPAEAMEAVEKHPGMLLRPHHFAAVRTNWNDKASNLREIAKELNVGIDSVAFIDDNPVERLWIREQIPEVTVIDLPADPMLYAATLRQSPVFERLELTDEDKARGRFYAEQRLRTELEQGVSSLEDFYRSLRMKVRIDPVTSKTLARAAQLTQKTNQFNLTTRRYSEAELADRIASPAWRVLTIQVIDRFGDNGVVGLAMLRVDGAVAEIDNFLLSCRVIGRTVETAFLAVLADEARRAGATVLTGSFIPTKKNAPSVDFYKMHQFAGSDQPDGSSQWKIELNATSLAIPPWIEMQLSDEHSPAPIQGT